MALILIPILAAALSATSAADTPISLGRKFTMGEKLAFQVKAHITAENRQKGLLTWIPEDFDLNYNFTTQVKEMKADGIAVVRYQRPTMTEIEGETFNAPSKTKIDKVDLDEFLTVSPINQILEAKSAKPKKAGTKPKPKSTSDDVLRVFGVKGAQGALFGQFIQEVHRLALCVGGPDSALDFSPKLSLDDVKVGDTWKTTVGYQPQKLKGKDGKTAVQRLDYTYTYVGIKESNGKKVYRVEAKLDFKTDLGDFLKQLIKDAGEDIETGLKKFPLTLKETISFDLDLKTHHTIFAEAVSEGGYGIFVDGSDDAVQEEKFKGRTTMELVGAKIIK